MDYSFVNAFIALHETHISADEESRGAAIENTKDGLFHQDVFPE